MENGLLSLPTLASVGRVGHGSRCVGAFRTASDGAGRPPASCRRQPECAVYGKGGARGYDAGKKIKGRKRHIVVDSQGNVLGVWVSAADVSDAQGAYQVLDEVLARYREAQVVIADSAYDREGLLEWLLSKWEVGLDCVARSGGGFRVQPRRWLVERSFAWLLGCRRLGRCYDQLCEVEAGWIVIACVRWLVRRIARRNS